MSNTESLSPNEVRMSSERMSKLVLHYSIPTIIGMLVNAIYNITDRFWVGRIEGAGADALIGIGITLPVLNILLGFAQLVGIGAAASISISLGKRNKQDAERILGNALVLSSFGAMILILLSFIFLEDLLWSMGASEATMKFALPYARIIVTGCFFQQVSFAMNHSIRAVGNAKRFASTQLIGAIANMILDPLFIFGFNLGIEGAGLATVVSQIISAAWVMQYYISKQSTLKIRRSNLKIDPKIAKRIYSIGFSGFFMQIAGSLVMITINSQLIKYGNLELGNGDIAVGAMTIVSSVASLFFMPIVGINQGMTPIIGFNFGAKDYVRVKEALRWGVYYAVIICVAGTVVVQLFSTQLVMFFNDDPDLIEIGSRVMRIHLLMLICIGIQSPCSIFFQAIGKPAKATFLSLLRLVIIFIPMCYILAMLFGFNGIWWAAPISDFIATIVTVAMVNLEMKKFRNIL